MVINLTTRLGLAAKTTDDLGRLLDRPPRTMQVYIHDAGAAWRHADRRHGSRGGSGGTVEVELPVPDAGNERGPFVPGVVKDGSGRVLAIPDQHSFTGTSSLDTRPGSTARRPAPD